MRMHSREPGIREVMRLVWREATPFVKRRLGSACLLVIGAAVLMAYCPVALKLIVDGFANPVGRVSHNPLLLVSLYVLSLWLARTAGEIRGLIYARAERRIYRTVSERIFAHLMQLPLRFHIDRQTGAVSQTLDNGLQGLQMILHHLVFTFLPVVAELGTMILVLGRLARPSFLIFFCSALVCYAGAFAYSATRISQAARAASAARVDASAAMTDGLINYETVKYFTAEALVGERVARALTRSEKEWIGFYRRYAANGLVMSAIFAAFLASTITYATEEVEAGRMTVGDFVLISAYMLQIVRPVEMLGYALQGFLQGAAMLEKMIVLLRETPERPYVRDAVPLTGPGMLEFEHVSLSYRPGRAVLRDVSLSVPSGRTLGVVGASGSGKSTLVRLLVRLLEPDSGRILLDGLAISELPLATLRQAISVVPQEPVLFNESIGYNIAFGNGGASREEVERAAKLAHLHKFITNLAEGYETRVGERGVKLSGGERQRISIARAAMKRPRIYVFDEATSSLDSHTEREILTNLREIAEDTTTLVIAHRLSTVVHADEIVVLDGGAIVERGSHEKLLLRGGHYAALWAAQHSGRGARHLCDAPVRS
jgi:ABC-type transport system involved in Fe-S cluster assembly fused permease/ATPase subunit